jgi:predicted nucleotidyltransferase
MIKYNKLNENIHHLIPKAVAYLQSSPDIIFAYLFGSFGRGRPSPLSDLDVAIFLKEHVDFQEKRMEILGELIDLLQTEEIDLVILNVAPLTLRMKILENKKVLVDQMPSLRHHIESLTAREYFDFSVIEKAILERRFFSG